MSNHLLDEVPVKKAKIDSVNEKNNYLEIFRNSEVILIDIEGTTTPITFVSNTLFPYAKLHVKSYFMDNYDVDDSLDLIKSLQEQCKSETDFKSSFVGLNLDEEKEVVINAVVDYVTWLIEKDKKVTPLKQLQGYIWKKAYENGEIKGEFFEDVQSSLETWKKDGKLIYIYSSGSVQAQKLLFQYSKNGNLLPLIQGHFDTELGNKRNKDSYVAISKILNMQSNKILFLTDITAEADAAIAAGMNTFILCRPGNKAIEDKSKYICIDDFTCLKA